MHCNLEIPHHSSGVPQWCGVVGPARLTHLAALGPVGKQLPLEDLQLAGLLGGDGISRFTRVGVVRARQSSRGPALMVVASNSQSISKHHDVPPTPGRDADRGDRGGVPGDGDGDSVLR